MNQKNNKHKQKWNSIYSRIARFKSNLCIWKNNKKNKNKINISNNKENKKKKKRQI